MKARHLAKNVKPSGLDAVSGEQIVVLSSIDQAVRTVTLDAPAAGRAVVIASWAFSSPVDAVGRCSITTGDTVDTTHLSGALLSATAQVFPASAVRSYAVTAGANTFNLVCNATLGAPSVVDGSLTALFVPATY